MKVYDLIQTYGKDCYVVATINSRDSEGCAEDVKIESFANDAYSCAGVPLFRRNGYR